MRTVNIYFSPYCAAVERTGCAALLGVPFENWMDTVYAWGMEDAEIRTVERAEGWA